MDDAEVARIIEQMHPKVRERIVRRVVEEELRTLVDEMLENGEIEFVPGTNQAQVRRVEDSVPDDVPEP